MKTSEATRIEKELQTSLEGCQNDMQKLFAHIWAIGTCYAVISRLEAERDSARASNRVLTAAIQSVEE